MSSPMAEVSNPVEPPEAHAKPDDYRAMFEVRVRANNRFQFPDVFIGPRGADTVRRVRTGN